MPTFSRQILFGALLTFFALFAEANAQNSTDKGTPAESKPGQSTVSTYARDKIETVNLANGNFSMSIPLATVGGRGSAAYTIALSYNSKVWSAQLDRQAVNTGGGGGAPPPSGTPIKHYSAMYEKPTIEEPGLSKLGGGWSIRVASGIKALTFGFDPVLVTSCNNRTDDIPDCGFKYALTKMWLTLPDGSQVELRDSLTQGAPARTMVITDGYHALVDRDRGRVWRSVDGSNVIFVRDTNDTANATGEPFFPSGWVFLPDGSRMRMDAGAASKIIDRNGNFLNITGNTYTDQLGRQTVLIVSGTSAVLTVKGYMGRPDRSLSIDIGAIGDLDNLRAEFRTLPRPFTTGDAFHDIQNTYFEHMIQEPHTDLFTESDGSIAYRSVAGMDVGEKTAVTKLELLDDRSFRFRYNQYGEVAEIVYPGGGVSRIDYSGGITSACEVSAPIHDTLNRRVSQRQTLTDGNNVDATWVYGYVGPDISVAAHQGDATGTLLAQETHSFLKVGLGAEYRTCFGNFSTGNEKWDSAKEYRSVTQTGTGTVVRWRNWEQRAPLVWGNDEGLTYNAYAQARGQDQPQNDERVTWEETTLENGKVKRVEYGYDQFNNVTSIKEYDFSTGGSPGTLLRQTVRTYGANLAGGYGISINGYCYSNLNPTDSSCGSGLASDVTSIIYQRHLLISETIRDGQGNQKAYSQFEYDNYTSAANHAALVINGGMIQYDGTQFSAFSSAAQPRGNVTKTTRWLSGGTDVVAYNQYDNAGNVVWNKDPKGYISTVSYADNFGVGTNPEPAAGAIGANGATFALASLAINPLGQMQKMQYDYSLGAATGVKDPNNVITKTEYDNLGRPFRATAALGLAEQTISETAYPTSTANEAKVSKQLDATRWLSSKTSFDAFDRPVLASASEDGLHFNNASYTIFSKTVYDPLGRGKLMTNPYRTAAAVTDSWNRSSKDLGGRLKEVASFAGGVASQPPDSGTNSNWIGSVTTVYASEVTTVTDQAGKKRRSVTDGLGRLVRVDEPDQNNNLDVNGVPVQSTSYAYDTLDNLITVTQGNQTRTFVYDSLKRLISATNPESGTISYQYDANGNLTQKTDARGIVSSYSYDALNRNITIDYSDTTGVNPDITRAYDGATNGKGRLWESYAGGTETAGTNVEHQKILSYDAVGRPLVQRQRFKLNGTWSQSNYDTTRVYNLAGGVTSQTYPSEHTVAYAYDAAGRTNSFTGYLGDNILRSYSTEITYSPLGALAKEKFGTDTAIYDKLFYNSRGQLAEIRATTSDTGSGDTTWNRGKFINWYSLQCGGAACNATDNNGNLRKQDTFIPNNDGSSTSWYQQYEYDSLNRLAEIHEHASNNSLLWHQSYDYDRYGNRTINANGTTNGINKQSFEVEPTTNRLLATGDPDLIGANLPQRKMRYDAAGNLTNDSWSSYGSSTAGAITRTYDAENRMTSAWDNSGGISSYTYNADGQRVRRKLSVTETETWQIYGMDGELLAEYAANAAPASPQKEYGYRNGQLLVTADASSGFNGYAYRRTITIDHTKVPNTDQSNFPALINGTYAYLATTVNGGNVQNASGYDVIFTSDSGCATKLNHEVESYNATTGAVNYWVKVPLVSHTSDTTIYLCYGNASITTDQSNKSGVWDTSYKGVWHLPNGTALSANDSTGNAINGTVNGAVAGSGRNDGGASFDGSASHYVSLGDPAAVDFGSGDYTLEAWIKASSLPDFQFILAKDSASNNRQFLCSIDPSGVIRVTLFYSSSGLVVYKTGAVITANNWYHLVAARSGNVFKVYVNGVDQNAVYDSANATANFPQTMTATAAELDIGRRAYANYQYPFNGTIDEVRISSGARSANWIKAEYNNQNLPSTFYSISAASSSGSTTALQWLVTDQLGTPRMIFDKTGSLAATKRHDYLPFGEEIFAGTGGRDATTQGYPTSPNSNDGVRQKFTQKERDNETGLDYFLARYYSSVQGRFTSPDEFTGGPEELFDFSAEAADNPTFYADLTQPQSLNKYQYCLNSPLVYLDPNGHQQAITNRILTDQGYVGQLSAYIGAKYDGAVQATSNAASAVVGFRAKVQKYLGTDRDSLIKRSMEGPFHTPRDRAEMIADQAIAFNDGLMIGSSKVVKLEEGGAKLLSRIGSDKSLTKLAEEAGPSVQKGIDHLTSELAKGNLNPGLGSKNLFGNVSYARARDGARVFFTTVGNQITILAKANKANEQAVINRLKKLYEN